MAAAAAVFLLGTAGALAPSWRLPVMAAALLFICFADVPYKLESGRLPGYKEWVRKGGRQCFLLIVFLLSYLNAVRQCVLPSIDAKLDPYRKISADAFGKLVSATQREYGMELVLSGCTVILGQEPDGGRESSKQIGLLVEAGSGEMLPQLVPGQMLRIKGKLRAFETARNEGGFDSRKYYRSIGIDYRMEAEEVEACSKAPVLEKWISQFSGRIAYVYSQAASREDASVISAMVLGNKADLDSGIRELYQKNGIAHILTISGLHVSLIGMMLYRAARRCGIGNSAAFGICSAVLAVYLALAGNGLSARRAVLMCAAAMGADVLGRTFDMLSALSLSMMLAVWENIWVLENTGFLLSYSAVLGIALLVPVLEECLLGKWRRRVKEMDRKHDFLHVFFQECFLGAAKSAAGSLGITLATLPVIAGAYFEVPSYSILLNLAVLPLMSVLLLSALAAGILGLVSLKAAGFFMGTSHFILLLYKTLCTFAQRLPGAVWVTGRPSAVRCAAYYGVLAALFILLRFRINNEKIKNTGRLRQASLFAGCALALILLFGRREDRLLIKMLDVGQGECILVCLPDKTTWLFDGGSSDISNVGEKRIYPMLRANGITKIDAVFVSHTDADHINGLIELFGHAGTSLEIGQLVLPDAAGQEEQDSGSQLRKQAEEAGITVSCAGARQIFYSSGKAASLECLHPSEDCKTYGINDSSAVYRLEYGRFSMLFTGDVEKTGEMSFLSSCPPGHVSVLKVAHHGSATSTTDELLSQASPQIALISCGINNRYGHPAEQTLQRLNDNGASVFATNESGQITIKTDGRRIWVFSRI